MPIETKRIPYQPAYDVAERASAAGDSATAGGPRQQRGLGYAAPGVTSAGEAWRAQTRAAWRPGDRATVQHYCDAALTDTPTGRLEDATLEIYEDGTIEMSSAGLGAFDRAMAALGEHAGMPGADQQDRRDWAALRAARLLFAHAERVTERCKLALRTPAEQPQATAWAKGGQAEVNRFRASISPQLTDAVERAMPRVAFEAVLAASAKELAKFEAMRKSGAIGQELPRLGIATKAGFQNTVLWLPDGLNHLETAAACLVEARDRLDSIGGRQTFTAAEREALRRELEGRLQELAFTGDCYVAELEIAATQELPKDSMLVDVMRSATTVLRSQADDNDLTAADYKAIWASWRNQCARRVGIIAGQQAGSTARN